MKQNNEIGLDLERVKSKVTLDPKYLHTLQCFSAEKRLKVTNIPEKLIKQAASGINANVCNINIKYFVFLPTKTNFN